ncbi:hypothetical protein SAMN05518801_105181 [Novosphingobium sp. CF614]|uniref:hypothetical protein n=1 Tax=Novosphingobium sp. CF614 TaxID=1884364 RepID=UPI0008EA338B|nr:hypothetical protein [Novosphingobium sp. CF614]SFG01392.1 hypothetical protein SAMN05518801_105181 [Novosphingobium sp. CF614]
MPSRHLIDQNRLPNDRGVAGEKFLKYQKCVNNWINANAHKRRIIVNAAAADAMHCERHMTIVPGAGHVFEEPGTLSQVFAPASAWFLRHLGDIK